MPRKRAHYGSGYGFASCPKDDCNGKVEFWYAYDEGCYHGDNGNCYPAEEEFEFHECDTCDGGRKIPWTKKEEDYMLKHIDDNN